MFQKGLKKKEIANQNLINYLILNAACRILRRREKISPTGDSSSLRHVSRFSS